ncbi:MAG: hypothetical protein K6G08_06905 [Prevotella sp.]|nr:hypothetical protein [Prevotella sp.]
MKNPFKLIGLMFKARRPGKIADIPAMKEDFWLGKNYDAMMFFGFIVTHTQADADRMNAGMSSMKRHETIHLRQAQSVHNSWFCYYCLYLWYYLRALPLNRKMKNAAYILNPFEMEAYENMYDKEYLDLCKDGAEGWRVYAKMKPRERLTLYNRRLGRE